MVNVDIAGILDDTVGEGAYPAAGHHPAAFVISKLNLCGGAGDEGFGTTVLAIPIGVILAVTECGSFIVLPLALRLLRPVEQCPGDALWKFPGRRQAGLKRFKSLIVFGPLVPTALWWVAQTAVRHFYNGCTGRMTEREPYKEDQEQKGFGGASHNV